LEVRFRALKQADNYVSHPLPLQPQVSEVFIALKLNTKLQLLNQKERKRYTNISVKERLFDLKEDNPMTSISVYLNQQTTSKLGSTAPSCKTKNMSENSYKNREYNVNSEFYYLFDLLNVK
jgi:hypothetical protein